MSSNSGNEFDLMTFRLAYLQAIAKAWKDEDFRDKLVPNYPKSTKSGSSQQNLNKTTDAMPLLKEFGFTSPWNIELNIIYNEQGPVWKPLDTAGWIGPNDKIIIFFPNKPADDQATEALAAYYKLFPSYLGRAVSSKEMPHAERVDPNKISGGQALSVRLINSADFLDFGGINLRAVALGWKESAFLNELIPNDDPTHQDSPLIPPKDTDSTPVLSKYLSFNNPWNFEIEYRFCPDFRWEPSQSSEETNDEGKKKPNEVKYEWKNVPKNIVQLYFPQKPSDASIHPIALTSYNSTGTEYPFTCN